MSSPQTGHRFWGILFILAGLVILIDSANILEIDYLFSTYWPVAIIALGIFLLTKEERNIVLGGFLCLLGIYFQLNELGWIYYPYKQYFFSIALILLGAIFIYHSQKKEQELPEESETKEATNQEHQP
ncbi:MAG: hypothetical protein Kow00108_02320 [Calditrichia bacterium]